MLSDDVFRNALRTAAETLKAWAGEFKDCADIEIREATGFWRISARPKAHAAAPFTLVLRSDQKFDLGIAGERYEDREIEDFELFPAIARAVSAGNVEMRMIRSALTNAAITREMRLYFDDGSVWQSERRLAGAPPSGPEAMEEVRTKRFLPYRR